jgi:long-chain acyl-CoA synthetase
LNAAEYILPLQIVPDRIALIDGKKEVSYKLLQELSNKASIIAQYAGIAPGDRVILLAENSVFWVASYIGLMRIGAVCVPLPMNITYSQLDTIMNSTSPKAIFWQEKIESKLSSVIRDRAIQFTEDVFRREETGNHIVRSFHADNRSMAAILFTSGSTGEPRGVMVSHRNIIANTESIIGYLRITHQDRIMVVLPFYYCFGTSLLHTHLRVGASLVLNNRFMFPNRVLEQMAETACTGFAGVPSTYQILLRRSSFPKMKFPNLKYLQQAGGKLPRVFIDELQSLLPKTRIFVMYGQTEATARLSYLPPELINQKRESIGKGIPGVNLSVLKKDGSQVSPGEIGEIVAEGDNITLGYWNNSEETSKTFRNGCLYTGDLATVDGEGFIFIVDRAKDILKCGGYRVSAREIEDTILRFPDLIEAAVVGVPDDIQGEAVQVFLVHKRPDQSTHQAFQEFCVKKLPPHLIPKKVFFLSSLPKSNSGKIMKSKLREFRGEASNDWKS